MHLIQAKILRALEHQEFTGLTLREIGEMVGELHPQKIKHHLDQLQRNGFIKINNAENRITKVETHKSAGHSLITIPLLGVANCGPAQIFAIENFEGTLKVSKNLIKTKKDGLFAIRASGGSMNRANIHGQPIEDGDYVIIDSNDTDPNPKGDYVLSIIDGCANIKKYHYDAEKGRIVLTSESRYPYPPIFIHKKDADHFLIAGKVIQVIKGE